MPEPTQPTDLDAAERLSAHASGASQYLTGWAAERLGVSLAGLAEAARGYLLAAADAHTSPEGPALVVATERIEQMMATATRLAEAALAFLDAARLREAVQALAHEAATVAGDSTHTALADHLRADVQRRMTQPSRPMRDEA